jgi:hypothetical protein
MKNISKELKITKFKMLEFKRMFGGSNMRRLSMLMVFSLNLNLLLNYSAVQTTQAASSEINDSSGADYCKSIAVDSSGNVYCTGLTNENLGETSVGVQDAMVFKMDTNGNLIWLTQIGATAQSVSAEIVDTSLNEECTGVDVDNFGNVYCSGHTLGSLGETSGGTNDIFILKLDSSGAIDWLNQIGGPTQSSSPEINSTSGNDYTTDIKISSGNIFISGFTTGSLGEGNGGTNDSYILKLDSLGITTWLTHLGLTTQSNSTELVSTTGSDECYNISIDSSGNIYCTGITSSSFGESNGGGNDMFVFKLDPNGVLAFISQAGSVSQSNSTSISNTSGSDYCYGGAVDNSGGIYCGGTSFGSLFEPNGGGTDISIIKINTEGNLQ